jgi:selenocysteine lyase/cysteine desulfurase
LSRTHVEEKSSVAGRSKEFPSTANGRNYLFDNAATAQKPLSVLDAERIFI